MEKALFVVAHKKSEYLPEGRTFIGVGANAKNIGAEYTDGDDADDIPQKNPHFCELTAQYHIWKHCKAPVKGLEHYRRFFCESFSDKFRPVSPEKIDKILKKKDLILPKIVLAKSTVYEYYKEKHDIADLDACRAVIAEKYPEYLADFDRTVNGKKACAANMLIAKSEIFDAYSKWLFDILFEVEKRTDLSGKDAYQARVFGFLSERLISVWVRHNRPKVKYVSVYMPDQKHIFFRCLKLKVGNFLRRLKK